jgi:hypothetical protein
MLFGEKIRAGKALSGLHPCGQMLPNMVPKKFDFFAS